MGPSPAPGQAHRFEDYPAKIVRMGMTVRAPEMLRRFEGQSGGKADGLEAFRNALLESEPQLRKELGNRAFFAVPKTTVLQTDCFSEFMDKNGLWPAVRQAALEGAGDETLQKRFSEAGFSPSQRRVFRDVLEFHVRPLAVRSSGLNEDAERASFAGIYKTVMIPNCHPGPQVRLEQLEAAIKIVYASTFSKRARAYRERNGMPGGEEQMAVLVQNMAGRRWQLRSGEAIYHPEISFAAFSFNDYATGGVRPEDGFFRLAFGAGTGAVDVESRTAVRVNMGKPLPLAGLDEADIWQVMKKAPSEFYALLLSEGRQLPDGEASFMVKLKLEEHPNQELVARHYRYYDHNEKRMVDFPRSGRPMPLMLFGKLLNGHLGSRFAGVVRALDRELRQRFGMGVDFECSADIIGDGDGFDTVLYGLQARPQVRSDMGRVKELPQARAENTIFSTSGAIGKGGQSIRHVLYVAPERFDMNSSPAIAEEIEKVNRELAAHGLEGRYVLLVPGRFGTTQHEQGVAGDFTTISHAGAIVEMIRGNWEPSQGTHFYEDMTGSGMAYMHVRTDDGGQPLLLGNLERLSAPTEQRRFVRHYMLQQPLKLAIDEGGNALLYSP